MKAQITQGGKRMRETPAGQKAEEAGSPEFLFESGIPTAAAIEGWLRENDKDRLSKLYAAANLIRSRTVGSRVHLRGLIEISNYCSRQCGYCGLRAENQKLTRYRMSAQEIFGCAEKAVEFGYGTVVLQGGEDYGLSREWVASVVRRIKTLTRLAVTLSLGERSLEDLKTWKEAGADRYLLRFETSDLELYEQIHPSLPGRKANRIEILRQARELGYEIGGGVMVGIPGQTYASVASDILLFRAFDLDMIGIGPYITHPETPLGRGEWVRHIQPGDQVPATEEMVYKVLALTRLACPEANLPSTTALATINQKDGRELGLMRGANVIMPNLTPACYRKLYEIYPKKACVRETAEECDRCLHARLMRLGRVPGMGSGSRFKAMRADDAGFFRRTGVQPFIKTGPVEIQ